MNDFRAMINDRCYFTTFIVGPQYVSVAHFNHTFGEILQAVEGHLDEMKKPFVIGFQSVLSEADFRYIVDNELADIILE